MFEFALYYFAGGILTTIAALFLYRREIDRELLSLFSWHDFIMIAALFLFSWPVVIYMMVVDHVYWK